MPRTIPCPKADPVQVATLLRLRNCSVQPRCSSRLHANGTQFTSLQLSDTNFKHIHQILRFLFECFKGTSNSAYPETNLQFSLRTWFLTWYLILANGTHPEVKEPPSVPRSPPTCVTHHPELAWTSVSGHIRASPMSFPLHSKHLPSSKLSSVFPLEWCIHFANSKFLSIFFTKYKHNIFLLQNKEQHFPVFLKTKIVNLKGK